MDIEQWNSETKKEEVSVTDLQNLISSYAAAKEDYENKKSESSAAHAEQERIKNEIIETLKRAGMSTFKVDGIGKVSTTHKFSVTTPKSLEDKKALLDYFAALGDDTFYSYASVNSQTLNSYYNKMVEEMAKVGETFSLPGVPEPTIIENISFRREK